MASSVGSEDETISTINITPFVDIVLVLLIILMVTSRHIVRASIDVELPKAASGGEAVSTTLNLVIDPDGELYLDGEAIQKDSLALRVQQEKALNPRLQAVISADKAVPYGRVVHIIDIIKTNGVTSFALNIERSEQPRE
ncbi:MAG: biopolymer transporter ExbD [Myxococcales bacterium]|nr:biopolymer transporter ExbD [Myxococcales bacterium]